MLAGFLLCFSVFCSLVHGEDISPIPPDIASMTDRDLIVQMMHRVNRLELDNELQQKRIEQLEDTISRQTGIIHKLEKYIEQLEKDKKKEPNVHEKPASHKHGNVHSHIGKQRIRQLTNARGSPVAFSALASHHMNHLGAHQNLVFEIENVDTANAYNNHHGVFTAPVSGVYLITASVLANQNREVWCDIVVNGVVKAQIYARGTDNRHDMGSQTILLNLKQGDDVAVQNDALDDSIWGELYTSFSGFLLYEDEASAIVG